MTHVKTDNDHVAIQNRTQDEGQPSIIEFSLSAVRIQLIEFDRQIERLRELGNSGI